MSPSYPVQPVQSQVGPMDSNRVLAVCLSSLFWACINVPGIEVVPESPDAGALTDAGPSTPTVALTLSRAATNSDVIVRVSVTELVPEAVELWVDGVSVASLAPPLFEIRWNTQVLAEGPHSLTARASLGGRVYESEVRTLMVDRTPPRVVTQRPRSGDKGVSVHALIQAAFSEAVEPTTVTAESVRLLVNQTDVAVELRLSTDGTMLTLMPVEQVAIDANASVVISSAVTDVAGNALDLTAFGWEWSIPRYLLYGEAISGGAAEEASVSTFSLVQDDKGRPVVAFVDGRTPSDHGVYVMRWSGTAWERLGGVLGTIAVESVIKKCSLLITPENEILVAWSSETVDGTSSIHVHRWNGGSWSLLGAPITPNNPAARFASFGFAVNPQGERYLAVQAQVTGLPLSMYGFRWGLGQWEELGGALSLNQSLIYSGFGAMFDSLGRLVVFWATRSGEWGATSAHFRRWAGTHWEGMYPWNDIGVGEPPVVPVLDGADRLLLSSFAQNFGEGRRPYVFRYDPFLGIEPLDIDQEGLYPGETDAMVEVLDFVHEDRLVALISEPEVAGGPVNHYVRQWDETSWVQMGPPLLPRAGATPIGRAQFFMTGLEQWGLARIEESAGTPSRRHLYVYRPNN
ncbi:Ig-like domain-containing protein [Myxococcus virescens]|uniref:Ig-like domain-containing protein n=1 Tax=Myxococcus virescens TaxID=83456 RepID=UPI003DA4125B